MTKRVPLLRDKRRQGKTRQGKIRQDKSKTNQGKASQEQRQEWWMVDVRWS